MLHSAGPVGRILVSVVLLALCWIRPAFSDETRPNIVVVMVDDMQLGLLSSMPTVKTRIGTHSRV